GAFEGWKKGPSCEGFFWLTLCKPGHLQCPRRVCSMFSLSEIPGLLGVFCYLREDDEAFQGTLFGLREGIYPELSGQLGRSKKTFRLWQDQEAIASGKLWETEIKAAIDQSIFFIPIVTPRSINSKYCKFEFESFLAREEAINRSDLIFPILYISVAALE